MLVARLHSSVTTKVPWQRSIRARLLYRIGGPKSHPFRCPSSISSARVDSVGSSVCGASRATVSASARFIARVRGGVDLRCDRCEQRSSTGVIAQEGVQISAVGRHDRATADLGEQRQRAGATVRIEERLGRVEPATVGDVVVQQSNDDVGQCRRDRAESINDLLLCRRQLGLCLTRYSRGGPNLQPFRVPSSYISRRVASLGRTVLSASLASRSAVTRSTARV